MEEIVALPDPETQPLVHPLDLPEARSIFRSGWLAGVVSGVPVCVLIGAIVGYLSDNWIVPVVSFAVLAVGGIFASRWMISRAWDYIPRKRQDRGRALPASWDIASGAVLALALGGALLIIVQRMAENDVPVEVRSFTFGAAVVTALLMLADAAIGLLRPAGRGRALASVPGLVAVALATWLAWSRWFDGDAQVAPVLWGALMMVAAGVLVAADRVKQGRRAA